MTALPEILEFQKNNRKEIYKSFSQLSPIHHADVDTITKKTIEGIYNNIPTSEIDKLSAEIAQEMCTIHTDNSILATRILVSNMQKNVQETLRKCFPDRSSEEISTNPFSFAMNALYQNLDERGCQSPLVAPYLAAISTKYSNKISQIFQPYRDFINHDYLGILTLENGYLFKVHTLPHLAERNFSVETPGFADLRVAIGLVCAPKPCPVVFSDFLEFLQSHPETVKPKYRDRIKTITSPDDKRLDQKLFRNLYWKDQLVKSLETVTVTDEMWVRISEIYNGMSTGLFTPATPTRFSAGTLRPQGSSCFLIAMESDSLTGIYNTLAEQSQISKHAGGIGIWVHNIRSSQSYIAGTNGFSNGLKPMLRVFDSTSAYVDQGGGKRAGSVAIYLEPWHADILDFLSLKRKKGPDPDRARRLFYALWVPDEFFRCWEANQDWYLFDPNVCPKLYDCYDTTYSSEYLSDSYVKAHKKEYLFTYRYRKYIQQGRYKTKIPIATLIEELVETVRDSGVPFILCKDAVNRKTNQKNLGVIKSSNLCTEICQYSDSEQTAVCNLHSICLNKFIKEWSPEKDPEQFCYNVSLTDTPEYLTFDFEKFADTVRICQNNIDSLIDLNFYPTQKAFNSNMKTRPQGLGVQGEADLMAALRLPWNSKSAQMLRFSIFEAMYYNAVKASVELAKIYGPYEAFSGSPASQGSLQHDLWLEEGKKISFPFMQPWAELRQEIKLHGLRNSLLVAPMPTASTSSIMGNSPSIEPFNSLVYIRKAGAGDVTIVNKALVQDLMSLNLWSKQMSDQILAEHGSIQNILSIPKKLRECYLTVYDLQPSDIIDAAFVRGWFVDQSQSMNLFFQNVTTASLSKAWTRAWKRGLKTPSYYCRTRPATNAQKNSIEKTQPHQGPVCSRDNPDCLSCGS